MDDLVHKVLGSTPQRHMASYVRTLGECFPRGSMTLSVPVQPPKEQGALRCWLGTNFIEIDDQSTVSVYSTLGMIPPVQLGRPYHEYEVLRMWVSPRTLTPENLRPWLYRAVWEIQNLTLGGLRKQLSPQNFVDSPRQTLQGVHNLYMINMDKFDDNEPLVTLPLEEDVETGTYTSVLSRHGSMGPVSKGLLVWKGEHWRLVFVVSHTLFGTQKAYELRLDLPNSVSRMAKVHPVVNKHFNTWLYSTLLDITLNQPELRRVPR